jgi:IS5 family transposase
MQRYSKYFSNGLFGSLLRNEINPDEPLMVLERSIDWDNLCFQIGKFYDPYIGRPSIDLRKLISITMLQNIYNLTDEGVLSAWTQNVVFQAFSGCHFFSMDMPFSSPTLCNFRKKIGQEGLEIIFAHSVRIHGEKVLEKEVIMDTTVQEKYTSFPTDTKLRLDVISQCFAFGDHLGIEFDSDYHQEVSDLKKYINFTKSPKDPIKQAEVETAKNKVKDIANDLIDQLLSKAHPITLADPNFAKAIEIDRKAVNQQKDDKDKIYSIFEPHVACIAKGKAHKKFEFGNKAAFAIGRVHKIILGAVSFQGSPYDGNTTIPVIDMMERVHNGYTPELTIGDLGYRLNQDTIDQSFRGVKLLTPADLRNINDPDERKEALSMINQRSAIEPIIGHMKHDHGLDRNLLHGIVGDSINVLSAAIGFNLKKFLNLCGAVIEVAFSHKPRRPKRKTSKVPFIRPKMICPSLLPNTA